MSSVFGSKGYSCWSDCVWPTTNMAHVNEQLYSCWSNILTNVHLDIALHRILKNHINNFDCETLKVAQNEIGQISPITPKHLHYTFSMPDVMAPALWRHYPSPILFKTPLTMTISSLRLTQLSHEIEVYLHCIILPRVVEKIHPRIRSLFIIRRNTTIIKNKVLNTEDIRNVTMIRELNEWILTLLLCES